ncbi:MAG: hypothetical protein DVS81_06865 [Candidatus Accumulibacter meliphilus]|uniref:Uncharacterized protein n=1 Tax=Candidatus Accumulibacter meliphilus TaxID=2211374 RepID=A0A369XSN5_9PROT|nr:MAG: hypothetical protein DVS81_06865 [Candidatus Accumulibacter meliphilus]
MLRGSSVAVRTSVRCACFPIHDHSIRGSLACHPVAHLRNCRSGLQCSARHVLGRSLLEPMQARFTLPSGEKLALSGFLAVDRKRLKALPAEKLHALAVSDELELIYLHL